MPRRALLAALALVLSLPLLLLAGPAEAATTKTASCTDGGRHRWTVKVVWGGVYSASGTKKVSLKAVRLTTKASTRYVSYTITTTDGSGARVQRIDRQDRKFSFKKGKRYLVVDPRNPRSAPGRTKVVVKVGDARDGRSSCTVTFKQPGKAPAPAPAPAPGARCAARDTVLRFTGQGSSGLGQFGQGNYDASAELWNVGGYSYAQTMGVCTHDSWYVDVKTDNRKGDGAVKAYPSMRRIYHDWGRGGDFSRDPLVSSFKRLDVSFASTDPSSCKGCIYNTAFDVWLNGIGDGDANELMIWTHNVNQRPYGRKVASGIKIAGHTWELWSGNSNHYLAFVPTSTSHIRSGTVDLKDFTGYLAAKKRIPAKSRLGQISFGVETVSTGGVTKHWDFTRFTVKDR